MDKNNEFDLQDFLPYLLNQAADATSLDFQKYYKAKYGMLQTEWRVIFHLGHYGNLAAKDICGKARMHKTKVSRAVAALEQKRFLSRAVMPNDRRHEMLGLTQEGRVVYRDLSEEAQRFDLALMSKIPKADRMVLRQCLRQIAGL